MASAWKQLVLLAAIGLAALVVDAKVCVRGAESTCTSPANKFPGVWDTDHNLCCFEDAGTCLLGTSDACLRENVTSAWSGEFCCYNKELHCISSLSQEYCLSTNNPFTGFFTGKYCCYDRPIYCVASDSAAYCRSEMNPFRGVSSGYSDEGRTCCYDFPVDCYFSDSFEACNNPSNAVRGAFTGQSSEGPHCCFPQSTHVTCGLGTRDGCINTNGPFAGEWISSEVGPSFSCCFPFHATCVNGTREQCEKNGKASFIGSDSQDGTCCLYGDVECFDGTSEESCGDYHFTGGPSGKCCYAKPTPVTNPHRRPGPCELAEAECSLKCMSDQVCPKGPYWFQCAANAAESLCACRADDPRVTPDMVKTNELASGCPVGANNLECSGHGKCVKMPTGLSSVPVCNCHCPYNVPGVHDCSVRLGEEKHCPGTPECGGNGECDLRTGVCTCTAPFFGDDCTLAPKEQEPTFEPVVPVVPVFRPDDIYNCSAMAGCARKECECRSKCRSDEICGHAKPIFSCRADANGAEPASVCLCRADDQQATPDIVNATRFSSNCAVGSNGLVCSGHGTCIDIRGPKRSLAYCSCHCPFDVSSSLDCSESRLDQTDASPVDPTRPDGPTSAPSDAPADTSKALRISITLSLASTLDTSKARRRFEEEVTSRVGLRSGTIQVVDFVKTTNTEPSVYSVVFLVLPPDSDASWQKIRTYFRAGLPDDDPNALVTRRNYNSNSEPVVESLQHCPDGSFELACSEKTSSNRTPFTWAAIGICLGLLLAVGLGLRVWMRKHNAPRSDALLVQAH